MAELTIAEIIKQAAIDVGKEEPSTIVASTDRDIKQLLQFALKTGRELRDAYLFPQMKKHYSFSTSASDIQYILPKDIWKIIPDSTWDETNSWKMIGPLTDQEWAAFTKGTIESITRKRFRVFGSNTDSGQYFVDPEPSASETISFDYIRKQWIFPVAWAASTAYTSGDIVSANGNLYSAGSTATSGATIPTGTTTHDDGTITWTYVADQLYGDSTQRWQADTDFPLIDSDLILLGTVWRFLKRKGLDYQEEKREYEQTAMRRLSRLESAPILNLAESGLSGFLSSGNSPEGNFG